MTVSIEELVPLLGTADDSEQFSALLGALRAPIEASDLSDPEEGGNERSYTTLPTLGISFVFDEGLCVAIQLMAAGTEPGMAGYAGRLPASLTFNDSMSGVLKALGQPVAKYKEGARFGNKPIDPWIKFQREGHLLHFAFTPDSRATRMVTLQVTKQ